MTLVRKQRVAAERTRAEGLLCAMLGLADALAAAPRIQNSPQVAIRVLGGFPAFQSFKRLEEGNLATLWNLARLLCTKTCSPCWDQLCLNQLMLE